MVPWFPRVGIKSTVWCMDTNRVIITKNTGKHEQDPLCPEEALQFLQKNSL